MEETKKVSASSESSSGDDTSTKATEENDSDVTMGSTASSDTKKDGTNTVSSCSDAETDVDADDAGSTNNEDTRTQEEKDREAEEEKVAEKKRIDALKLKYKDWPLKDITTPHDHDVMYGRGGGTNHHIGNKRYRLMVESRKLKYVNSKRLDKPMVALEIIAEWRKQLPPGRFLKHNDKTNTWEDVGDKKAREKTSQALREKAPELRKKQEDESNGDNDKDKTVGWAKDTKKKGSGSKIKRAILARDHSLGRDYLGADEKLELDNFSWQEGVIKKEGIKESSIGSTGPAIGPRPSGVILPPGREISNGSVGFNATFGRNPPPPVPPNFYGHMVSGNPTREYSNGSMGSWNMPHLPPPQGRPGIERSGSWTHSQPPPVLHNPHHQRSGSWNEGGRDHSFSMNPLPNTYTNRPAPMGAFDPRGGSGSWSGHHGFPQGAPQQGPPYPIHQQPPPQPPPSPYGGFGPYNSGGSMGTIGSPQRGYPYPQVPSPSHAARSSPPHDVATTWTGGGAPHPPPPPPANFASSPSQFDAYRHTQPHTHTQPNPGAEPQHAHEPLPRPGMVKRDTSNQNEPPRTKKATLSRDRSETSSRLKQQYMPEALNQDVQYLQKTTENLRLSSPVPHRFNAPLDAKAQLAFTSPPPPPKPAPMNANDRTNTIDEFGFEDLIDDIVDDNGARQTMGRSTSNTVDYQELPPLRSLNKPPKLTAADRMTTTEFHAIINTSLPTIENGKTDDDEDSPLPL